MNIEIDEVAKFSRDKYEIKLLHDTPNTRILLFCFEAGQELPVHSHDVESDVSICVLEGKGYFTGGEKDIPAKKGSLLVAPVSEPHGVRAETRMKVLVSITPPL